MNIKIPPYIASNTYTTPKISSVSFILDLKNSVHYVLLGECSILWNFIINSLDYDEILNFAVKNNLRGILDEFLGELKAKNFIIADFIPASYNKYYLKYAISEKSENIITFLKYKKKLLCDSLKCLDELRLSLNYTCNLNCKHCCNPKNMYDEMTFNQAKEIIDEAVTLGVNSVSISGGECTINKDFLKIAKYVRSKYLELDILTNAQKLFDDKSLLENIINLYPSSVQVSLYSINPSVHDYLTGVKGSLDKSLYVIKKLRESNTDVNICCVQFSYNRGSYLDVKKFADSLGCGFITDCKFIYNPNNNNLNAKLSESDIEEYYLNTIDVNNPRSKDDIFCSGGMDRFEIMPNLDINPCPYFYYTLGNYKNISLTEVKNTTVKELHNKFKRENLKDCYKYDYCQYCLFCPRFSGSLEKDGFLKKSEILCEDAKAYQKAYLRKNRV